MNQFLVELLNTPMRDLSLVQSTALFVIMLAVLAVLLLVRWLIWELTGE